MKIKLSPVRADITPLQATIKNNDIISINGVEYDFSPLNAGETLPMSAVGENHPFVSDIVRDQLGELHFTLLMPHGRGAPSETRYPDAYCTPISIYSGELSVPPYESTPASSEVVK